MEKSASALLRLQFLRKPLVVALATGCLALTSYGSASAALSLTPEKLFNFDFTNPAQPAGEEPPYLVILLNLGLSGGPGSLTGKAFADLDGGGGVDGTFTVNLVGATELVEDLPFGLGALDGKFSIALLSSDLLLDSITATGCIPNSCIFETAPIDGTLVTPVSVPEPASLALLGIAIAGLAATRRKRRS